MPSPFSNCDTAPGLGFRLRPLRAAGDVGLDGLERWIRGRCALVVEVVPSSTTEFFPCEDDILHLTEGALCGRCISFGFCNAAACTLGDDSLCRSSDVAEQDALDPLFGEPSSISGEINLWIPGEINFLSASPRSGSTNVLFHLGFLAFRISFGLSAGCFNTFSCNSCT